eukprot:2456318-Amphidinium_carterae.1
MKAKLLEEEVEHMLVKEQDGSLNDVSARESRSCGRGWRESILASARPCDLSCGNSVCFKNK